MQLVCFMCVSPLLILKSYQLKKRWLFAQKRDPPRATWWRDLDEIPASPVALPSHPESNCQGNWSVGPRVDALPTRWPGPRADNTASNSNIRWCHCPPWLRGLLESPLQRQARLSCRVLLAKVFWFSSDHSLMFYCINNVQRIELSETFRKTTEPSSVDGIQWYFTMYVIYIII